MRSSKLPEHALYCALLSIYLLVIAWKSFVFKSLWLDECVSYWVVSGSLGQTISRALEFQGQSPFYFGLLWVVKQISGEGEVVLRAISIASLLGASVVLYRIASNSLGREGGILTVIFFLMVDTVLVTLSARPYALALLFVLSAFYFQMRWLKRGGAIERAGFIISMALAAYCHYLFLLFLIVSTTYFCFAKRFRETSVQLSAYLLSLLALALLVAPLAPQVWSLWRRSHDLMFAPRPELIDLWWALVPKSILLFLALGAALSGVLYLGRGLTLQRGRSLGALGPTIIFWYVVPPLVFFAVSWLWQGSLFVPRYFVWCAPALALGLTILVLSVTPRNARQILVCTMVGFALFREVGRNWVIEEWKGATERVALELTKHSAPVLFYSGLIESEKVEWLTEPRAAQYLRAPLLRYPLASSTTLLPSTLEGTERQHYFEQVVTPAIQNRDEILFLLLDRHSAISNYYQKFFGQHGYRGEIVWGDGPVKIMRFSKGAK